MSLKSASTTELSRPTRFQSWSQKSARTLLFKLLGKLQFGTLTLQEPDGSHRFGNEDGELHAHVVVNDMQLYSKVLKGGTIAAGECYFNGLWDSDNVTEVIRLLAKNQEVIDHMDHRFAWITQLNLRFNHFGKRNTRTNSKKNIVAHYDLGNDFYKLFLDDTMMYSSAVFNSADETLYEAQINKLDAICQRLELKPGENVVEIGSGWGSFAIHAAKNYGVHVTTTTISEEQHAWAQAAIEKAGLQDQITLLKEDYRNLSGEFDKLVSIEMIEAVGHQFLPTFFKTCSALLKPSGRMLIQAITISDQRYDRYRRQADFIQAYIFPGGFLPSIQVMNNSMAKYTDLKMTGLHDIGLDYALTLRRWSEKLKAARDKLPELGLDETFYRMWQFYLHYCEGGFMERQISTVHLLADKPRSGKPDHAVFQTS